MTPDERRPIVLARAKASPEGLTPYGYTRGMYKADALQFWNDAKALGLVVVGTSTRGAKILALADSGAGRARGKHLEPPVECPACVARGGLGVGPCNTHSADAWAGSR